MFGVSAGITAEMFKVQKDRQNCVGFILPCTLRHSNYSALFVKFNTFSYRIAHVRTGADKRVVLGFMAMRIGIVSRIFSMSNNGQNDLL